ncbi:MAG: lasso RiPP family leader peptide-containing protein [Egibacteraceae bacterium]
MDKRYEYEVPTLADAGAFVELTRGPSGACTDGFGGYKP